MTTNNRAIAAAFVLLCLSLLLGTGCQTSPEQFADKSLASTAITVDRAMQGWAAWVVVQRANPAADQAQLLRNEGKVLEAYTAYQAAARIARAAWASYSATRANAPALDSALSALSASQANLVALVTTLTK